jgi:hypothetical protein
LSVYDRRVPDALYQLGVCPPANSVDQFPALLPVIGADAQLDQLVLVESDIELGEHSIAGAPGTDTHHRIQMVGPGAQSALLFSR